MPPPGFPSMKAVMLSHTHNGNIQGPHLVSNGTLNNLYSPVGQLRAGPGSASGKAVIKHLRPTL